jgi:hypothetical protein
MKNIELTDEQYEQLIAELHSLYGYHWNDSRIHADNCGSKVVDVILAQEVEAVN